MKNLDVRLELEFDADQVTGSLDYRFIGSTGSIFRREGRCANTFHFPSGGNLFVEVTGTARKADKMRFMVNDFTLASISTLGPDKSDLSLFDPGLACISISNWDDSVVEQNDVAGTSRTTIRATNPLPLVAKDGQWQMSGYLSVAIEMLNKTGKLVTMQRLFYFDPESTAGSGGDVGL
jgi:hypothetical protein